MKSFYDKTSNFRVADLGNARHYVFDTYFDEYITPENSSAEISFRDSADLVVRTPSGGSTEDERVLKSIVEHIKTINDSYM